MRTALIATGLLIFSGAALAEEPPPLIVTPPPHEWFVEGGLGGAHANLTHVEYNDPVGSIFTLNAKHGTGIIPQSVNENPWSSAATFSAGHFVDDRYFIRATYRYFGTRSATANGLFFSPPNAPPQLVPTPIPQSITTTAHGFFLGAGIEIEPGEDWFIDPSAEIGAVLMSANGIRDVDTIIQQPFPSRTQINPAYGAGLAIGKRLNSGLAIEVLMNWDNLGRADTATAPDIGGAPSLVATPGVPGKALMTAKLKAASIMLGIRYDF